MYILLFLKLNISGASHFSEIDIIKFLHHFQYLKKKHGMNNNNLIKIFLNYYEREKRS